MCFDTDSQPPVNAIPDPGVSTHTTTLIAGDQNCFLAYVATPAMGSGAGVIILPDVRGLYPFYESVAVDLANQGYHAVVIDYYGRTAGVQPRTEDFEPIRHAMQTTTAGVRADIRTAAEHLRFLGVERIAALGFCFGGRHAFFGSMPEFGFDAVVGFYGMPGAGGPLGPGPTQVADQLRAPILGVFGGADEHIPQDQVQAFAAALTSNGVEHELLVYPNAPHSFFDVKHSEHTEASIQAWTATHRFLNRVLRRQTSQSP